MLIFCLPKHKTRYVPKDKETRKITLLINWKVLGRQAGERKKKNHYDDEMGNFWLVSKHVVESRLLKEKLWVKTICQPKAAFQSLNL